MKNTLQVLLFLISIFLLLFFTKNLWEGWLLGALSILTTLSVIFISFVIFLENRRPTQTLTWLVVLGSFPLLGFFFYLLFGRNYRKKKLFRQKALFDEEAYLRVEGNIDQLEDKIEHMEENQLLFRLAHKLAKSPITFSTDTRVLTNGEETFSEIFAQLEKATHHIHLEYYIVRDDQVGQKLKNILINRAKNGVQVRFLYDAVGSWKLSKKYISDLKEAGVEIVSFSPVKLPFLNNKINFRNHRKIIVIDGTIGFVGGLNIGDEYLGRDKYFGFWRDTHLVVKGEAVRSLQLIFLQDWHYMTGKANLSQDYLSPQLLEGDKSGGGVQMIAGGPDNEWEIIKNLFFSMIISAKESIWISSPYFIPDDDILSALKIAALSGIDVRILVPQRPDKKIVFYASRSYFPTLLEAGAKIYEYRNGFMHNKIIIVDGQLASIGTANMDMRSFHLNFEINAFLYKTSSTTKLVSDFLDDFEHSSLIKLDEFNKRSLKQRIFESTSRLLSPLL